MDDERLQFMKYIAGEAGNIIMSFWDSDVRSRFKDDKSVVTEADLRVSEFIQTEIPKRFPSDGLLDEEVIYSTDRISKNGVWIIDPLDGSGDFKRKENDFCFLGAYAERGIPIIGVVYEPLKERLFFAQKGHGAYVTEKGSTSRLGRLSPIKWDQSIVGHPKNYKGDKYSGLYKLMEIPDDRLGRSGSMGTRMMQVALEKTHMILGYTRSLKEWDIAAGHVVLEERGISVTDIRGNSLKYNQEVPKTHEGILVVHPDIKKVTLEKLARCYDRLVM